MRVRTAVAAALAATAVLAGAGAAAADEGPNAQGAALQSPGIAAGDVIQPPVTVPINISNNSINIVGIGDTVHHNNSAND
ncbi:chaplin family protein [Streptomyces sp. CT34]|uniref:chaplin family protein n=1 Tax=Streptomyces sp. CT34 TaxID=1553907 RepID=UPI0005BD1C67|nr:chaplin family protein [Streptomyces sp. CT34]